MKAFVKLIIYIGFLFFGGGFLIALGQFIIYNGMGNIFEYVKPADVETSVEMDSIGETQTIYYKYKVQGKEYTSKQSVYTGRIAENDFYVTNIYYNKTFPFFSYIGDKSLKLRSPISGMIIMGFFFLLFFMINKFADMDKWIGVYTRGEYKSSKRK